MSRDVLKLGTQVVGPAVIGRDAGRGAGGEGVGNEAGRGAAASGAQAKWLAVALEAGHGQGEPRAGSHPRQGRPLPQEAGVSHAEGPPCLHQFVGWSDLDPRAQARGPRWLGRAQKVLGPYPIRLSKPAGGFARETGEGAVWLEAIVQDIIGVCKSGGWAGDLMCIRFFWKEKGGGRGLFKPVKQNSPCQAVTGWAVSYCLLFKSPPAKPQAATFFPHQEESEATSSQIPWRQRDQSRKISVQVLRAQLAQGMQHEPEARP